MKATQLEILIPTYNRCKFLIKNLHWLSKEIREGRLEHEVAILISNNHSSDSTKESANVFISENADIKISFYSQQKNIGLEPNVVDLMSKATSPYIMWVGDDDYVAKGYLNFCVKKIKHKPKTGCIIPGLANLFEDGSLKKGRIELFETKNLSNGFDSMMEHSHLAHQMSGLLLKKEGLLDSYLQFPKFRNPYLFIYWTAHSLYHNESIYAPIYKTEITTFNEKDWSYNKVGLLDQVFKSYYPFIHTIGENNVRNLLLRFSVLHSYRYDIHMFKPLKVFRQYQTLIKTIPKINGIKKKLAIQLIKEYILSFIK